MFIYAYNEIVMLFKKYNEVCIKGLISTYQGM